MHGSVGLDVGWRLMDDGSLRVACWYGNDRQEGEWRLPARLLGAFKKVTELQSIRKTNFNNARDKLVKHFKKVPMPTWARDFTSKKGTPTNAQACAYLSCWKSEARLTAFVHHWHREGITEAHQEAYWDLEEWRYHDHHLWEWQTSQQRKAERRRKDIYRNWAHQLSHQYKDLVLEDFDLRKVLRRRGVDEESGNKTALRNRELACIHELRDVLRNAFEKCGSVTLVKAANTTRECNTCGTINTFDAAVNMEHRCDGCGTLWDQDENAARIICARGERSSGEKTSGTARM